MKCIVCGKKTKDVTKFDHGELAVCSSTCRDTLNYRVNGAAPILWFSVDDLRDEAEQQELSG